MKRLNFDFSGVSQMDWAKLAAFVDSEGHIRIVSKLQTRKNRPNRYQQEYLEVTVANTSPRLMVWLVARFGGTVHPEQRKSNKRPAWKWYAACAHGADVLRGALPHFVIKQDQAELALAFCATLRRSGVKGTPQVVREHRQVLKTKLRVLTARGPRVEAAS